MSLFFPIIAAVYRS